MARYFLALVFALSACTFVYAATLPIQESALALMPLLVWVPFLFWMLAILSLAQVAYLLQWKE